MSQSCQMWMVSFGSRIRSTVISCWVLPRRDPLLGLVDQAVQQGVVAREHLRAARAVEAALNRSRSKPVPMNIDGATAVIYAELGFAAPLARGLFVLSRSVGILAHAWEEMSQGRVTKARCHRPFGRPIWESPATSDGAG
jgi:citrate synthase